MGYRSTLLGGFPYTRDPAHMPRWYGLGSLLIRSYSASAIDSLSSTFYTSHVAAVDRIPGTQLTSSSFTAGTWNTIASVSAGSGVISDVIGPQHQGGGGPAGSTEFRFTIDGTLYPVIAITHAVIAERSWLGWPLPTDAYHAGGSPYAFQHGATHATGYAARINSSSAYLLMGPQDPRIPDMLYFSSSLLVEIRTVSQNSNGSLPGDYAAVVMRRIT